MRILRHIRGNPDTGLYRSLPSLRFLEPETQAYQEVSPFSLLVKRRSSTLALRSDGDVHMTPGESDQAIVLRGRESRLHGEGPDSRP
jgi:hypothetical protein